MGVSVRTLAPALVAAVLVAGGVWVESGSAQPEKAHPSPPAQPSQPTQTSPAQPGQPSQPGPPGRGGPGGQPFGPEGRGGPGRMMNLEGAMRLINRGFRDLNANAGDASKREENLSAVWMMQQGCAAAKRGKPDHLEGDPTEALETFRREQIKLMGTLVTLESEIMDNKTDEAKATLADLKKYQEESHKKYQVKEEDEDERGPGGPGGPGGPQGPGERLPPQPPSGR